jgi:predicted MFS family arabinose efflux permease
MAVVPNLVKGEEELTRANALLGASWAVGQLVGPALGGILVATLGPHGAALFDAGTYLLSAMFITFLRVPIREHAAAQLNNARQALRQINHELMEGVRVVLHRPVLRVVFASLAILFLSQGIINVLLIVIVNQIWHVGATEFGWFISVEGVGGLLGTAVVGAIAARVSPKRLVIVGGVIAGAIIMLMVNQPSIYVAMGLMLFAAIAIVAFDVGLTTLIQMGSDDANRGRVSGLMQTTMAAAQLLAIGATSLLADQVGAVIMLNIAAILFSAGGLVAIFAPSTQTESVAPNPAGQPAE